jgi:hypothetical protein
MKPAIKKKWIAALRSGEYAQTRWHLRDDRGYCCLGVLCDLHAKANKQSWSSSFKGTGAEMYLGQMAVLPNAVATWAGLSPVDNSVVLPPNHEYHSLVAMNDRLCSFKEIADVIDKQL